MIKFILYLIRWQLSTPILAPVISWYTHSPNTFGTVDEWLGAAVANLIGGSIFFWVDRFIFKNKTIEKWEVIEAGSCHDCGRLGIVRRLVETTGYDRRADLNPEYRCGKCSKKKLKELSLRIRNG